MASDPRFDRIQRHLEGCLLESGVFERGVEGAQLFDVESVKKYSATWLLMAAGISASESYEFVQPHRRDRATVPMQIVPKGQLSLLLLVRPYSASETRTRGKFVTEFSLDVGEIELSQGSYFRVDNIESPAIRQIRWELDAEGYRDPMEPWLRRWKEIVGCNPAHPPSHWHINSPPIQQPGRRGESRVLTPPEVRIAAGIPNPLLLLLSIANWLKLMN